MLSLNARCGATLLCFATFSLFSAGQADCQFTTIYNVPPFPAPSRIGSHTQLNLFDGGIVRNNFHAGHFDGTSTNVEANIFGGTVGNSFYAFHGSAVNISGGSVGNNFRANSGSSVNISGGSVGHSFEAFDGSAVNITGGSIESGFRAKSGSTVNIYGGEFRMDGEIVEGLEVVRNSRAVSLLGVGVLSGTLADGTPFAFLRFDSDDFAGGTLTLHAAALPDIGPPVITLPIDPAPLGVRTGQTLVVEEGGVVRDSFNANWGSTVIINGGDVGHSFEAVGAQVTISGGSVGDYFDAFGASTVNIFGGSLGGNFRVAENSTVNISGGSVGSFRATDSSTVNISGGSLGGNFRVAENSTVNISGGSVGSFRATDSSTVKISGGSLGDGFIADNSVVKISGGEFRVNGVLIEGLDTVGNTLAFDLHIHSVLSGTLADGTPFAFSPGDADTFSDGSIRLEAAALPASGPPVITLPVDPAPLGIRTGQSLVVEEGGVVRDNFNANWGSTIIIDGGEVGRNFEAVGAQVTISGGMVGDDFDALNGSTVNISGGIIGDDFDAFNGSTVNISGGAVGNYFRANPGSTVNISDGSVGDFFNASGDTVNISGGSVGGNFDARGNRVNISGGSFGNGFSALNSSTVNISGGSFGNGFSAFHRSAVNISGGSFGSGFKVWRNNTVNISGGSVGDDFNALGGSTVNISGGSFRDGFSAKAGSMVKIIGGEFRMDGVLVAGLNTIGDMLAVNLPRGAVLSGTMADGTLFALSTLDSDRITDGALTLEVAALPAIGPPVIMLPGDPAPSGIRTGQTLVVEEGGVGRNHFKANWGSTVIMNGGDLGHNFEAVGAEVNLFSGSIGPGFDAFNGTTVNISGGSIGGFFHVLGGGTVNIFGGSLGDRSGALSGGAVNISGGSVGSFFEARDGSEVNISGGSVGHFFEARLGSAVNISGGSVGAFFEASYDSTVNISGGSVGDYFDAHGASIVNISGGTFGDDFHAFGGSTVNLFGTQFVLGSMDITSSLTPDVPFTINDRDVSLTGLLADGSPFAFDLFSTDERLRDFFHPGATLTVTLVSLLLAGDTNGDGVVNVDDLNNVRNNFGAVGPDDGTLAGDAYPFDGMVDIDDLNNVRNNFGRQNVEGQPVPETVAIGLLSWGLIAVAVVGRRRRRHSQAQ